MLEREYTQIMSRLTSKAEVLFGEEIIPLDTVGDVIRDVCRLPEKGKAMDKSIEAFVEHLQVMSQEDHARAHGRCRPVAIYDFEACDGVDDLSRAIHHINRYGYALIAVTQYKDEYTVFFRR